MAAYAKYAINSTLEFALKEKQQHIINNFHNCIIHFIFHTAPLLLYGNYSTLCPFNLPTQNTI